MTRRTFIKLFIIGACAGVSDKRSCRAKGGKKGGG